MCLFLKKIMFSFFLFFCLLSCSEKSTNSLIIAPLFSDHMVLQQKTKVPIWGKGEPGDSIFVSSSWYEKSSTTVGQDGNWKTILKTPPYGGPYKLNISSTTEEINLEDVLVGEVWLASGQSNMEYPIKARILNQKKEIKNSDYQNIRMFSVPRNLNGQNIYSANWKISNPKNVKDFSAVAYFFARKIHKELDIPVGIINSSWGGTRVEAWTSIEKLADIAESETEAKGIIKKGGLTKIFMAYDSINLKNQKINEVFLNAKGYKLPQTIEEWESLTLDDLEYSKSDFDDDSWDKIEVNKEKKDFLTFEDVFSKNLFAEDGVAWFRKKIFIDDPNESYELLNFSGIGDYDYSYMNDQLIGVTLACCLDRKYKIPKGVLKKGENILAIRVINTEQKGGFKGPLYLQSNTNRIYLNQGIWRYKHIAFYLGAVIQKHNFLTNDLLTNFLILKSNLKTFYSKDPNYYGILYETMIKPLVPYSIKGFLWYQGESNVANYSEYQNLFTGMISDWRDKWNSDLPFYYVQIAPFSYNDKENGCNDCLSYLLREAQLKSSNFKKTGMVVTSDIGEQFDIHPANKQQVGERLANLALINDYNRKDITGYGPIYSNQKKYKHYIDLYFKNIGSGLKQKDSLKDFEIAGSDKFFYPAQANIIENKIRVSSKKVKNPEYVRYGWKNYYEATLFNNEGFPASSFRTP